MKAKAILSALCLSATTLLSAQSTKVESAKVQQDSLIVISERDLIEGLKLIAQAAAAEQPKTGVAQLTAEDMKLVKYQILLNALGLGTYPAMSAQQRTQCASCSKGSHQHQQHVTQPQRVVVNNPATEARLDRIERALEMLLMQGAKRGKVDTTIITMPAIPLQPATRVSDKVEDPRVAELERKIDALLALKNDLTAPKTNTIVEHRTETVLKPIGFKRQVFFAQGSSVLSKNARATLGDVVRMMSRDASLVLSLTGFASPEGSVEINQRLSRERSQAVRAFLIASGIAAERLIWQAAGVDAGQELQTVARRVDIELARLGD